MLRQQWRRLHESALSRVLLIRPTRSEGPETPVPPFAHRAEKVCREPRLTKAAIAVFCTRRNPDVSETALSRPWRRSQH